MKERARQRGLPFNLDIADLTVPATCPVLGIPIVSDPSPKYRNNWPSVDRLDNSKGYTKENVRVISRRANSLKSDATIEEMRAIVAYMESGI